MKAKNKIAVLSVLLLFSAGCTTVGPDYTKPAVQEPKGWLEKDQRIMSEPADLSRWWKVFGDPTLDALIEKAYEQNLSLQTAGIRILEARAQLGIAIGAFYPQTQRVEGTLTDTQLSKHTANTTPSLDFNYNDLTVGLGATWEIDFWGKFRRGMESGFANLEGTIASYDDVLVSLTADVALTYTVIRTLESRLEVAKANVTVQQRTLQITEAQFKGGLVSELDVLQAKNLLSSTEASIPPLEAGRVQAQNALATLLGILPEQLPELLGGPAPIPSAPVEVAVGIPAELLRRRPDIRLAERRVAAQSPLIGVAKADLYPHFSLFGTLDSRTSDADTTAAGSSNEIDAKKLLLSLLRGKPLPIMGTPGGSELGDLFSSHSWEYRAGPSFAWDVLNYGRIKNRVRVEDARFQELAVNYQNTVLRAFQEVEDGLVGFLQATVAQTYLGEAADAAKRAVDISLIQYEEGLVDYQRVLDAQRALASSQDALVSETGLVVSNLIAVYRALGGGWEIRVGNDFVPAEIKEEMRSRTKWGKLLKLKEEEPKVEKIQKLLPRPDW